MVEKYFWRRTLAYTIDLLICGMFVTVIAVFLNSMFSTKILAPPMIKNIGCELRDNLFTTERMDELLPLEEGQIHQQVLCKQTNMLFNSFYITRLQKVWSKGNANYNVNIGYYSDENGKQVSYIESELFVYLLAPFIFALFLAKRGQTPGKRMLNLTVYNDALEKPDLKSALKREFLKAILFVIPALFGLYTMFKVINFDIDNAAELAQSLSTELEQSSFLIWGIMGLVAVAIVFWFYFGSFIRWKGRTYWDSFAKLNTNSVDEFNMIKSLRDK